MGMRMCYSVDFGPSGKLKLAGGSLRAIIRHNCRKTRLAGKAPQGGVAPGEEACGGAKRAGVPEAEMTWKENIDPLRFGHDQIWFNPAYGHGNGGWVSPQDLPDALTACPEKPVMDAMHCLLGIEDVDGVLRYGEVNGDCGGRRAKPDADARTKWRRKACKTVRSYAVLAEDIVLLGSPSFFFPKIRAEEGTQVRIDKSLFWERGALEQGAVNAFREAELVWVKDRWGEYCIAEVSIHLVELCLHMHTVLVLEQNGRPNVAECIVADPADAREMLDVTKWYSQRHES